MGFNLKWFLNDSRCLAQLPQSEFDILDICVPFNVSCLSALSGLLLEGMTKIMISNSSFYLIFLKFYSIMIILSFIIFLKFYSIMIILSFIEISIFLPTCIRSCLLQICFQCERVNPFPHTTILQQTSLNIFCQKIENLYN